MNEAFKYAVLLLVFLIALMIMMSNIMSVERRHEMMTECLAAGGSWLFKESAIVSDSIDRGSCVR